MDRLEERALFVNSRRLKELHERQEAQHTRITESLGRIEQNAERTNEKFGEFLGREGIHRKRMCRHRE